jgi:hypothetical protein
LEPFKLEKPALDVIRKALAKTTAENPPRRHGDTEENEAKI